MKRSRSQCCFMYRPRSDTMLRMCHAPQVEPEEKQRTAAMEQTITYFREVGIWSLHALLILTIVFLCGYRTATAQQGARVITFDLPPELAEFDYGHVVARVVFEDEALAWLDIVSVELVAEDLLAYQFHNERIRDPRADPPAESTTYPERVARLYSFIVTNFPIEQAYQMYQERPGDHALPTMMVITLQQP